METERDANLDIQYVHDASKRVLVISESLKNATGNSRS